MFEVEGARQLDKAKVPYEYEPKDKHVPYTINAEWVPDFVLNGRIYVELKGKFDAYDKRKLVAVRRGNSTLDLRIVFYSATKTNVRWAEKHGWKWAAKTIPQEWIKEAKDMSIKCKGTLPCGPDTCQDLPKKSVKV